MQHKCTVGNCTGHKCLFRQKPPPQPHHSQSTHNVDFYVQVRDAQGEGGQRAGQGTRVCRSCHARPALVSPRAPPQNHTFAELLRITGAKNDKALEVSRGRGLPRALPASYDSARVSCARVYQAALFKNKITTLKDRKKVNGKRVWV